MAGQWKVAVWIAKTISLESQLSPHGVIPLPGLS